MVKIFVSTHFSSNFIFAKISQFHTFSKPEIAKNRPGPTSVSFEPLSIPSGLPLPINRCPTSI